MKKKKICQKKFQKSFLEGLLKEGQLKIALDVVYLQASLVEGLLAYF